MNRLRIALAPMAVATALVASGGCGNGPPGGGFTNGSAPDLTQDKQSIRTDGPDRDRTDQGEMKGAGGLATMPNGGGEKDSGSGGKGGNSGEAPPANSPTPRSNVAAPVPASAGGGSAAGATKPSGDIKVGTPKSPQ